MPIGISTEVGLFSQDENARKNSVTHWRFCTETYVACVPPCVPKGAAKRNTKVKLHM